MELWGSILLILGLIVVVPTLLIVLVWRTGMRSDFFFSSEYYDPPITVSVVSFLFNLIAPWFEGKTFDVASDLWTLAWL